MQVYLNIIQIILGFALTVLILLEVHSSGLGGAFGGAQSSATRQRRGPELLLFRLTVGTSVIFFLSAILTVLVAS